MAANVFQVETTDGTVQEYEADGYEIIGEICFFIENGRDCAKLINRTEDFVVLRNIRHCRKKKCSPK